QVRRREPEDGQARVALLLAPLRRSVARARHAAARNGLRRVPEQAAVQREEGRRQGDRVLGRAREDPLAEEDRAVGDVARDRREPTLRRRLERIRLGARRAQRRSRADGCTWAPTTATSTASRRRPAA